MYRTEKWNRKGCVGGNGDVFVSLASSLPGMVEWPGIHWMKMKDKMELTELWIEEIFLHNDLPPVQKIIAIEGWLVFVDVQGNADSIAAASSS